MAEVAVAPDETNAATMIHCMGSEDATMTEGTITYDIRFVAVAPKSGELIRLIINVEAQNDFYPGYPLIKRGIYYGENSITRYSITEENLVGNVKEQKLNYDLMTAIMICPGRPEAKGYTGILKLLDVLLSTDTSPVEKCHILEEDFQIEMTQTLESEVSLMCNLSKGVEEKGMEKGMAKGMAQGIQGMVSTLKDLNMPDDTILKKLQETFNLTLDDAQNYLSH